MIAPSNRSASRSSRPDQNHLYHDQMVLRGKRPPFLDIIADGDAETMTFVVHLGRDKFRNGQPYSQHDVLNLVTVIDISRRCESTKGHATMPNDIFRKLQPTHAGLAPHHAPTIWGRPQRVGVNPPQYIGVPTPTTPTRWGPLGSCDPNALGQIPQCPNTLGSIGVADPNALGSLDGICSQRSCQG